MVNLPLLPPPYPMVISLPLHLYLSKREILHYPLTLNIKGRGGGEHLSWLRYLTSSSFIHDGWVHISTYVDATKLPFPYKPEAQARYTCQCITTKSTRDQSIHTQQRKRNSAPKSNKGDLSPPGIYTVDTWSDLAGYVAPTYPTPTSPQPPLPLPFVIAQYNNNGEPHIIR